MTFEKGELDELRPESTRMIEVTDFVDLAAVDPIFYETTYWLAPDGDAGTQAYQLLRAAMEERGRWRSAPWSCATGSTWPRSGRSTARSRSPPCASRTRSWRAATVDALPDRRSTPEKKALALATQIIDSLAADWKPEQYRDTYTDELRERIADKEQAGTRSGGGQAAAEEKAPEPSTNVVDLMAALERSVSQAAEQPASQQRHEGAVQGETKTAAKTAKRRPAGEVEVGPAAGQDPEERLSRGRGGRPAGRAGRRCRGLPRLRPVGPGHPDRLRRGPGHAPASCWSASSPATRRTEPARRSWARRGECSTTRSPRPASTGATSTSPTRSSTSSGSPGASDASTSARTAPRSSPAGAGSKPSWTCSPPTAVVVALGATAGQALFGPSFRVGAARGKELHLGARPAVGTIHPSAVLRAEAGERDELYRGLVADLERAARLAAMRR